MQHRRVQRIVQVRYGVVRAVYGQRVLDQVVGTDGQEIEATREGPERQRSGRDLDHATDPDAVVVGDAIRVQTLLGLLHQLQSLLQLVCRRQHWDEQADLA